MTGSLLGTIFGPIRGWDTVLHTTFGNQWLAAFDYRAVPLIIRVFSLNHVIDEIKVIAILPIKILSIIHF